MFCVECGKETDIYKEGVCLDCYLKTHTFTSGPDIIDVTICSKCGAYKYKNTWVDEIFTEILRRIIKDKYKIANELKKIDINPICQEKKEGAECKVYITGKIIDKTITEEHDLKVRFKKTVCETCSRQYGGYHEAIIQIRTDEKRKLGKKELEEIISFVENIVENLQAKGNRTLFITDIGKEHGGLDFFISDRQAAYLITKKIQEQYGGQIKQSSKNIGMKDSKQIYRMTYLLRFFPFKKNDIINHENRYYMVERVHANKIKMYNLANWEETSIDIKNVQNSKIIGGEELVKNYILVSQNREEIQIMNPDTYEISIVKKPNKEINVKSKNINMIKIRNKFFIEK